VAMGSDFCLEVVIAGGTTREFDFAILGYL